MDKQLKGILREWNYIGNDSGFAENSIYGKIYNHVTGEYKDGTNLLTSAVRFFSENGKYVHTQNSIYELDPPVNSKQEGILSIHNSRIGSYSPPPNNNIDVLTWKTEEKDL